MKQKVLHPFQAAVAFFTEKRGMKTGLAKVLNKSQQHVSAIAHGKTMGNEEDRRVIAGYFGFDYDGFISFGRELLEGGPAGPAPRPRNGLPGKGRRRKTDFEDIDKIVSKFKHKEWFKRISAVLLELEADNSARVLLEDFVLSLRKRSINIQSN